MYLCLSKEVAIMIFMNEEEFLTNETIERLTENMTEKYLEAAGKRAGNRVSFSLTVQEILLRFRDLYGTGNAL